VYSRPDANASGGQIRRTMIRPILTDDESHARKVLDEYHNNLGETVESCKLIKALTGI